MGDVASIFERNRRWAERVRAADPGYFDRLASQQTPDFLWIGCADSRVPANQIVDLPPGEVFVHRNIANVVVHSDLNCLSVLQYAVEVLRVKHVIVCGHYQCGGVKAALEETDHGLIDNWLNHIRAVYRLHRSSFTEGLGMAERVDRLCELNVIEQVNNVCSTTVVRDAWRRGQELEVHGMIYALRNGVLQNLVKRSGGIAIEGKARAVRAG